MRQLGVMQLNLVLSTFIFLYDMNRMPQTSDKEKECVINSVPKFTVYKNKWALLELSTWQDERTLKICAMLWMYKS